MNNQFITFEGIDGAGKTTLLNQLTPWLKIKLPNAVFTREPGGNEIAEQIRHVILNPENITMHPRTEILLYEAARAQLIEETIKPALNDGQIVFCDRYIDSTIAYQGGANHTPLTTIDALNHYATNGLMPSLTFYFDLTVEVAQQRISNRNDEDDRLDQTSIDYQKRVRDSYLKLAHDNPDRIQLIDGTKPFNDKLNKCKQILQKHFGWEV